MVTGCVYLRFNTGGNQGQGDSADHLTKHVEIPPQSIPLEAPGRLPARRAPFRLQKEQLGNEPDVLKVCVVTFVPDGVMFELSR